VARALALLRVLLSSLASGVCADEPRKQHFHVLVAGRKAVLTDKTIRVTQDDEVHISWDSDSSGVIHLHGYDVHVDVIPGTSSLLSFTANATGRFPIRSHGFADHDGSVTHDADTTLISVEVPRDDAANLDAATTLQLSHDSGGDAWAHRHDEGC